MKGALLMLACGVLLASCSPKKETPQAAKGQDLTGLPSSLTPQGVFDLIQKQQTSRGRQWCVPTPGLIQLDERVLYYETNPSRPQAVMSAAFRDLLLAMEKQSAIRIERVASAAGQAWTVVFLPEFRIRFGVTTTAPIRGASLSSMCVSPIKVTNLVSTRTATYQGYRWTDVKVSYGGDPSVFPPVVNNPVFREFVGWNTPGARRPEEVAFGDARLELQDGRWYAISFQ